jgi:hypothetical protein
MLLSKPGKASLTRPARYMYRMCISVDAAVIASTSTSSSGAGAKRRRGFNERRA